MLARAWQHRCPSISPTSLPLPREGGILAKPPTRDPSPIVPLYEFFDNSRPVSTPPLDSFFVVLPCALSALTVKVCSSFKLQGSSSEYVR